MAEARNLRNMASSQTPLLGQENTPMHGGEDVGTGFESATPRHDIAATPNPLATPARGNVLSTPRTVSGFGATPARTPMRDNLSINDETSVYGETPRDEKLKARAARRALQAGFASLPKPENNFELADTQEEEEEEEEVVMTEEDAAERDARLRAAREREEQLELERRSSVVKKGLPRPIAVNTRAMLDDLNGTVTDEDAEMAAALRMINLEVAMLMRHDSIAHSLPGTSVPGGTASEYEMPEDDFVAAAKTAIHTELAGALGLPGATDEQLRLAIGATADDDAEAFATSWAMEREGLVFSPSAHTLVEAASISPAELSAAYSAMIESSRERMVQEATRATKVEKKLAKQLGGYQVLHAKVRRSITDTMDEIHATQRELETFLMLKGMEEAAAPGRLEKKREEVTVLERRERDLQARYAELNDERREKVAAIEQVSAGCGGTKCVLAWTCVLIHVEQLDEDKVVYAAQAALEAQEGDAQTEGDQVE